MQAAREAERCLTEIKTYKVLADKAENEMHRYKQELSDLKSHNLKIEGQRYDGAHVLNDKFEQQKRDLE